LQCSGLALQHFAFAGAATACFATVGERDARRQGCINQRITYVG
jgi:hypothetical protein